MTPPGRISESPIFPLGDLVVGDVCVLDAPLPVHLQTAAPLECIILSKPPVWLKLIRGGHIGFHRRSVADQRAAGFVFEKQVPIRLAFYYPKSEIKFKKNYTSQKDDMPVSHQAFHVEVISASERCVMDHSTCF